MLAHSAHWDSHTWASGRGLCQGETQQWQTQQEPQLIVLGARLSTFRKQECPLPGVSQRDPDTRRRAGYKQTDPPTYPPKAAPHLEDPKLLVDVNTQGRTSSLPLDWNDPEVPIGPALLINSASS